jgi:ferric-dicitrate binding protein FerR (iron transport regulator)
MNEPRTPERETSSRTEGGDASLRTPNPETFSRTESHEPSSRIAERGLSSVETAEEALVRALIESAGRGPSAPESSRARVYSATHAAWRRSVAQRRARRNRFGWMAAAVAAVAAVGLLTVYQTGRGPAGDAVTGAPIATVAKVEGSVYVIRGGAERRLSADAGLGESVGAGETVSTSADGGLALAYAGGLSLRIGHDSLLVLESSTEATVERGLVYVDAGRAEPTSGSAASAPSARFELATPLGSVRHIGTQYEAIVAGSAVTVRVREGSVGIVAAADGGREVVGEAGQQIRLRAGAQPRKTTFATHGAEWAWVEQLATIRARNDYRVADLLEWIARETGRRLEYESEDVETSAAASTLHGLQGLTPQEALEVVAGTTRLAYRLVEDRLVVTMR